MQIEIPFSIILPVKHFYILIIFNLLICPSSQAQDYKADLSIRIHSLGNNKEFITDLQRRGKEVKIVFTNRDSVSKALGKDERFVSLYNALNSKDSIPTEELKVIVFKSLFALVKEYTFYTKDSVQINLRKHRAFDELLKKAANPTDNRPEEELERSKKRIVLDGTSYTISIRTANKERNYQLSSPTPASHPFLYQIIHEPLNFKKF